MLQDHSLAELSIVTEFLLRIINSHMVFQELALRVVELYYLQDATFFILDIECVREFHSILYNSGLKHLELLYS